MALAIAWGALSVQIFLSYARSDDRSPPNMPDGKGFVTFLHEQIHYEFEDLGAPWPTIWRDQRSIDRADQFDPMIAEAIDQSDLFLAVLSPNWMESDYCKEELERFRKRWDHEGELRVRQRIIVACKRFVDRGKRPSLMQGQTGYDFFVFDGPKESGQQLDFFSRGEIRDRRYNTVVEDLSRFLHRRTPRVAGRDPTGVVEAAPAPQAKKSDSPPPRAADKNALRIYLAKPASDMREAYTRLVEELSRSGYAIMPDPDRDIPFDRSAAGYIDEALAEADMSIHLLGNEGGYTPEKSRPIVDLQLERAKARLAAAKPRANGSPGFRRIIWAPEVVEGESEGANGGSHDGTQDSGKPRTIRSPNEVLAEFGTFEEGDKVPGGTLSKFVDFLRTHLAQSDNAKVDGMTEPPSADDWVYVYHVPEDTQYACDLIDALRARGVAASPPAFEGDQSEVMRVHQQYLAECSAVILCWAQATEAWAHARARELKDLARLGRDKKFAYRGLLAGPPAGERKSVFVKYPPPNALDVVVNLNEDHRPLAEAIDKFTRLALAHAQ